MGKQAEVEAAALVVLTSAQIADGPALSRYEGIQAIKALREAGFTIAGPDEVPMPKRPTPKMYLRQAGEYALAVAVYQRERAKP